MVSVAGLQVPHLAKEAERLYGSAKLSEMKYLEVKNLCMRIAYIL